MSMTNWPLSAFARSLAISGVCASARLTRYIGPKVSFIATNAAAMPAAPWKKRRLGMPSFLEMDEPSALTRASNSFCLGLWACGENSSLETLVVGMGERNRVVSAGIRRSSSSADNMTKLFQDAVRTSSICY